MAFLAALGGAGGAAGGAAGAGEAGGAGGGMGGMGSMMGGGGGGGGGGGSMMGGGGDMMTQAFSAIMQNQAKRKQQGMQTNLNAALMRNSPWTGLAGHAAGAQDNTMQFNPSLDLSQKFARLMASQGKKSEAPSGEGIQSQALGNMQLQNDESTRMAGEPEQSRMMGLGRMLG